MLRTIMLLLAGLVIGQMLGFGSARRMAQSLEGGAESMLRVAAMGARAERDFDSVRQDLKALLSSTNALLPDAVNEVSAKVDMLSQTYGGTDKEYRRALQSLLSVRQGLSGRIKTTETRLSIVEESVKTMMAQQIGMFLITQLGGPGPVDLRRMSPEDMQSLRHLTKQLLDIDPSFKQRLEALYPGLIEGLYSSQPAPPPPPVRTPPDPVPEVGPLLQDPQAGKESGEHA